MRVFYYVHTGHRIGLDRFRRAAAIISSLGDIEITLLCSDFRIAQIARDFGVENSVGIDVVRNIPQITHHGDQLIFDSAEANPLMLEDMRNYFSSFIRVSDTANDIKEDKEFLISPYLDGADICNTFAVDEKFFATFKKTTQLSFFFGDDDYEKDLEKILPELKGLDIKLQLGFYYFLDYEDFLKEQFNDYFEFEDYDTMIQTSAVLITSSPQAVLESLAAGGKPVYVQREDYVKDFIPLFKILNVPILEKYDASKINSVLRTIDYNNYKKVTQNSNKISKFIKENLNL